MILTLLLIIAVYFCAKELIGRWWALLPSIFIGLSPNFLAHGHYVTTDVGATLGIFISIFFFLKFISKPDKKNLIIAGLAFGVAQLMKFSAFLLVPYFLLIISIFYLVSIIRDWKLTEAKARFRRFSIRFIRYFRATFIIFIIGYILVFAVYTIVTWNYPTEKQVADSSFVLSSFSPRFLVNFDIWMIKTKILKPVAQYFLGLLMVTQRAAGGNTAYFMGDVSGGGWWYYFPLVYLMKESLPVLLIIFLALIFAFKDIIFSFKNGVKKAIKKFFEYLNTHFMEFSMLTFVTIYWVYSMKSPLNIGVRHLMPTLPFIYILSVKTIKKIFSSSPVPIITNNIDKISNLGHQYIPTLVKKILLAILIIWLTINAFTTYPYFLSRFNELAGGNYNGYKYVTDSNFDWGQDLKRLNEWTEKYNSCTQMECNSSLKVGCPSYCYSISNPLPEYGKPIEKIAVDYFGGGVPKYYLGDKFEQWWSSKGNPLDQEPKIEWIAVSANSLQGAKGKTINNFYRSPEDSYEWLTTPYSTTANAGTSIFIYKLSSQ